VCRQHSNRQNLDDKSKPEFRFLLLLFIWFTYHRYNCAVFVHGCSALDQIFALRQFSKNIGSLQKTSTHVLSTSSKQTTGFLGKSFGVAGGRCSRLLVTNHQVIVFPVKFMSVLVDLNNKQFTAGVGLRWGCVLSLLIFSL